MLNDKYISTLPKNKTRAALRIWEDFSDDPDRREIESIVQTLEVLLGEDAPEKSGIKLGILELTVGRIAGIDFIFGLLIID